MELASVSSNSTQRLSARFASALAVRLAKRWPGLYKALNISKIARSRGGYGSAPIELSLPLSGLCLFDHCSNVGPEHVDGVSGACSGVGFR